MVFVFYIITDVRADIVCSSLTKLFNGRGDVMAGSLVINPTGRRGSNLASLVKSLELPSLYFSDAITLEVNSRDFLNRIHQINGTTLELVNWFNSDIPYVQSVYYPSVDPDLKLNYDSVLRSASESLCPDMQSINFKPAYSCLFTVVFSETKEFSAQV